MKTDPAIFRIASLISSRLHDLLRIIDLESNGQAVSVDEVWIDPAGLTCPIRNAPGIAVSYEDITAYRSVEPRLIIIQRFLSRLLCHARFFSNGREIIIDAFRLKNLGFWSRYPSGTVFDNLGELSSTCNCDCKLCFLKGSKVHFPKKGMLGLCETRTRIRYFNPEKKKGLPPGHTLPGEPFLNPNATDILKMARETQPTAQISITTNGELLGEDLIRELAELKPITLVISLNSADPENRRHIMKSRRAKAVIEAIPLLRQYGIQFSGSILAPADLPLSDLENTSRFLDRHGAVIIRIPLPGYTRFHPPQRRFDTRTRWDGIVDMVSRLRNELVTPFLVCPSFYWNRDITARIDGVFDNSPARRAGIRFGDCITRIDDQIIITRSEAALLLSGGDPQQPKTLRLKRDGTEYETRLTCDFTTKEDLYPFKPAGYPVGSGYMGGLYGIHLTDGLQLDDVLAVFDLIRQHPDAKTVLIFTTPLVRDLFAQAVMVMQSSKEIDLGDIDLKTTIAPQRFWGGNIMIGDLNVVQDYIDHLEQLKSTGYRPDLAVIPGSFTGEWGFDLTGTSYMEIEKQTGIKIAVANNHRVMV